jgi:hypothetical protein
MITEHVLALVLRVFLFMVGDGGIAPGLVEGPSVAEFPRLLLAAGLSASFLRLPSPSRGLVAVSARPYTYGGIFCNPERCIFFEMANLLSSSFQMNFNHREGTTTNDHVVHHDRGMALRMAETQGVTETQLGRAARHRGYSALTPIYLVSLPWDLMRLQARVNYTRMVVVDTLGG